MRNVSFLLLSGLAAGCKDKGDTAAAEEDPAAHACEHAAEPGAAVTAGATAEEAASIALSEEPYAVSLPGGAGFVAFSVAEATDALLLVDTADVVASLAKDGQPVTLPAPAPNELCPGEIPEHYDLALEAGEHTLGLGPSAVDALWLMLIAADGHAHDG